MPSPRLGEPSIPKDGRSVVQDNTYSDMFQLAAPVAVEVGQAYLGSEFQQQGEAAIVGAYQESQKALAALQPAAQEETNQAVTAYDRQAADIRSAVQQGAIGASSAKMRLDSLTRDYARRFPAFASEFTSRNSDLNSQAAALFEQDSALAQQAVQAQEVTRIRNMVVDAGLNPNNPADVAYVRQFAAKAVAAKAADNEATIAGRDDIARRKAAAGVAQVDIVGLLGPVVNRIGSAMQQLKVNPRDPNSKVKYDAAVAEITAAINAARGKVLTNSNLPADSAEAKALLSVIDSYESSLRNATDVNSLFDYTSLASKSFQDALKSGFFVRLNLANPVAAESVAAGVNPADIIRSFTEFAVRSAASDVRVGSTAIKAANDYFRAIMGSTGDTQIDASNAEEAGADAVDPKKPTTPRSALASREILRMFTTDVQTNTLDEAQIELFYRRNTSLPPGQRLSLGAIGTMIMNEQNQRGTNTFYSGISRTPDLGNQVTRGIARANNELVSLSRDYDDIRLYWNKDDNQWALAGRRKSDGEAIQLQNSHPVFRHSEDMAVGSDEAQFPASGELRDTLNGLKVLVNQGYNNKDVLTLFDSLNPLVNPPAARTPSSARP